MMKKNLRSTSSDKNNTITVHSLHAGLAEFFNQFLEIPTEFYVRNKFCSRARAIANIIHQEHPLISLSIRPFGDVINGKRKFYNWFLSSPNGNVIPVHSRFRVESKNVATENTTDCHNNCNYDFSLYAWNP